jgi:RHS repeat-associated protein
VSYSRSWDSFARPLTYPLGNPAGTGTAAGMVRTVGYDDAGRITAYTHVRGTTAQTAFDQTFSYDGLGRITVASQGAATYAYTYDASGNRLSYRVATTTFTNTVSATSNRLATVQRVNTSGATVTDTASYDLAGNTLSNGSAGSAVYSDRGRLATANVPITGGSSAANYRYNALEQRLAKAGALVSTGVAYYVYDEAGHVLGEYDINGIPLYEVIWLEDRPVAIIKQTRTGSGATLAVSTRIDDIYADHLNTPRVIARGTDHAILWRWESTEVFGVTPANENPNALGAYTFNLRFPGQIYDKETTGHYNWNRDYSSWVGRYMQSDPIGLQGGINTYVYVGGNSISFVDPTGLICTYSQSSGAMSCTNAGGQNYYNASGYAGTGAGRNNHDAQGQGNVGPLPRGDWQATGNWYNSPNTGRNTIRLTPMPGNECGVTGRDCSSFRIHGNNASNDASHGCIVLPPNRTVIPPGEVIRVVP